VGVEPTSDQLSLYWTLSKINDTKSQNACQLTIYLQIQIIIPVHVQLGDTLGGRIENIYKPCCIG